MPINAAQKDIKTASISLHIDWNKPEEAKVWVRELLRLVNYKLSIKDLELANSKNEQLELLLEDSKQGTLELAFKRNNAWIEYLKEHQYSAYVRFLNEPYTSGMPIKPNKKLIILAGVLFGGCNGLFSIFIRVFYVNQLRPALAEIKKRV